VLAQNFPADHPAMCAVHYRATGRFVAHPDQKYGQGEVWAFTPSTRTTTSTGNRTGTNADREART
jgi:hypothetical protein